MQITEDLLPKNLLGLFTFGSDLRIWSRRLKKMVDKTLTVLELSSLQVKLTIKNNTWLS